MQTNSPKRYGLQFWQFELSLMRIDFPVVRGWITACLLISLFNALLWPIFAPFPFSLMLYNVGCVSFLQCLPILWMLARINPQNMMIRILIIIVGIACGAFLGSTLIGTLTPLYDTDIFAKPAAIMMSSMLSIFIAAFIFGAVLYLEIKIDSIRRLHLNLLRKQQAKNKYSQVISRILRSQTEPHFLLNLLASITALFQTDLKSATKLQTDLILFLNSTVETIRDGEFIPLFKEIQITQSYLDIQKYRLGDKLSYQIDHPKQLDQILIPAFLIQPLVENAIKHGIEPKIGPGRIDVIIENSDQHIKIAVIDSGLGLKQTHSTGIGLTNIRERLDLIYGQKAFFKIYENIPNGVKVIIKLPYRNQQMEPT